ncbi:MAG: MATE family efflux transporter [Atopobiaceae bacterium]|nr:MATE family efflux transporter [Atopobiaceae bacterium]
MAQTSTHDIDMLHGPLVPKIIAFALPVAASGFLQQLFNAADVAVVGRFAGSDALAAVGANTYLISLMVNLFVGVSLGANVTIANCFGRGDEEGVRRATHTSIALSLVCGCVLLVAGQLLARTVHQAIGTPDELMDQAMLYFRIYYLGMPPIMLYNFASAVLRSKGDTRRPLVVLIISGVLNVLLNLLFVVGLGLDVAGVALATLLSNVASSLALVQMLRREEGLYHLSLRQLCIDRRALGGIVRVGLPAGIQSSIFSLSNIVLQAAINSLGQTAMAATTVATNFEYFTYNAILGFSQAGTTFVSQNDGAGNEVRCRRVTRLTLLLGPAFTLAVGVFFYVLRVPFVALFTTDAAVKPLAYQRILRATCFQWVNAINEILSGAMRGYKLSVVPAAISIIGICGTRVLWVHTGFVALPTYAHLVLAYPLSWAVTAVAQGVAYALVMRKRSRATVETVAV